MDSSLIRKKIDNLAAGINDNPFSYDDLLSQYNDNIFLATQIALSQCYKYEFHSELAQRVNLFGNDKFFQFRSLLEQSFHSFIKEKFLTDVTAWDTSLPAEEYIDYLKQLIGDHSSFNHRFFTEFVAKFASKEDLRFYLAQESSPRFDDLLALIQIGNPMPMKMELARNYWDEMGKGNFNHVHAAMFAKVLQYFDVTTEYALEKVLVSSLVSDNLSAMLAIYRENYAYAIGFLAVTEYCVPLRFNYFIKGCQRLGVCNDVLAYHILHTDIDGEHAEGWFREIVVPMIKRSPDIANKITEGALLKLNSSTYFFDGILEHLLGNSTKTNLQSVVSV